MLIACSRGDKRERIKEIDFDRCTLRFEEANGADAKHFPELWVCRNCPDYLEAWARQKGLKI